MSGKSPFEVRTALRFLRALAKNNDRAWFAQHRAVYDAEIKPQFEDFVTALLIAGAAFDERLAYVDPRACIFRLHRDIRFSKDKTPFKTWISAWLSPYGKHGSHPGFYVGIEAGGESIISAGVYTPERPVLAAIRRSLARDSRDFDRIVADRKLAPYQLKLDEMRTMPPGYQRDHPRAALIRARYYLLQRQFSDAELGRGNAFTIYRNAMRDCAPLVRWLWRYADDPTDDPRDVDTFPGSVLCSTR